VASFFVVDARTQHTFFARDSRHCEKPFHERHLTKSGFGKPKAAKLDNPSDAVLRERGARRRSWGTKAKPLACNPPTAVCACHARPPLLAALVCRRTRRLLSRRIKWRAPYMIDEPTHQRPRRDDCGSPMINLTYEDREELIIAAVTGAALGFVGGYYLDHSRGFGILIWVIVCAVIASAMVYCLRAIR
jgi:hypothetical protein